MTSNTFGPERFAARGYTRARVHHWALWPGSHTPVSACGRWEHENYIARTSDPVDCKTCLRVMVREARR